MSNSRIPVGFNLDFKKNMKANANELVEIANITSVRSFIIAIIDDIMAIRKLITNRYDTRNSNNINIL